MTYLNRGDYSLSHSGFEKTAEAAKLFNRDTRSAAQDAIDFNMAMNADSINSDEILKILSAGMKTASSMKM